MRSKYIVLVASLFAFILFTPVPQAEAQEVIPFGSGNHVVCEIVEPNFFGKVRKPDRNRNLRKWKIKRRVRKSNKKLRKELTQEDFDYWTEINTDFTAAKSNYKPCRRGTLNQTDGGGDGGGGGVTSGACSVITGDFSVASSATARIINGTKCSVTTATPTVYLDIGCTGTVIASNVVLTAGHCTDGQSSMNITTGNGTVSASQVITHPGYSESNSPAAAQDLGILLFGQDLGITPASLSNSTSYTVGEETIIGGYGLINPPENQTDGLYAVHVNLVSSSAQQVTTQYTASQHSDSYGSSCNGDSGGPLYVKRGNQWVMSAVVSNGDDNNCGFTGNTDTANYTNVAQSSNKSFIQQYAPTATFVD